MGILKDAILAAIQQEHPDAHWVGNFSFLIFAVIVFGMMDMNCIPPHNKSERN